MTATATATANARPTTTTATAAAEAQLYALEPTPSVQWALPLVEGSLAVALDDPAPSGPPRRARLSLVPPPERDLEQRAGRFVQAVLEVSAGTRPLQQLVRILRPDVYEELHGRLSVLARARTRTPHRPAAGRVASVHVCRPRDDVAEVSARVVREGRSRAVAARLEHDTDRRDPTWICTALVWV